jgi:rhomboid family GlyGly-CTERM serine protease
MLEPAPIIAKDPALPVTADTYRPGFLRSLNCDGRYGLVLLLLLAVLILPLAGGEAIRASWRYDRLTILTGEWWRLGTAHLVHLDVHHALLNAAGFALLWALFARSYAPLQWLVAVVVSIAGIDSGLLWLSPQVGWYVGASALLHGIFACGCIAWIRTGDRIGIVALVLLVAKLAWEHYAGPLPMMGERPVLTISHVYGAAGGVLAGLLLRPRDERLY